MKSKEVKWQPTNKQNQGIISNTYSLIKKELLELQKETKCPDEFVYRFLEAIKSEWDPSSCHIAAKNNLNF